MYIEETTMKFSSNDPGVSQVRQELYGMSPDRNNKTSIEHGLENCRNDLAEEVRRLLSAIDAAMKTASDEIQADYHFKNLAHQWKFMSPKIHEKLGRKGSLYLPSNENFIYLYAVYSFLLARKSTLELNEVSVPIV